MCTLMEHATEKRRISLKNTVVGFKSFHLCENFKCFEFFEIQVMSTVLVSQHTKKRLFRASTAKNIPDIRAESKAI